MRHAVAFSRWHVENVIRSSNSVQFSCSIGSYLEGINVEDRTVWWLIYDGVITEIKVVMHFVTKAATGQSRRPWHREAELQAMA